MISAGNVGDTPFAPIPDDWTLTTVGDEYYIQLGKMLDAEKNQGELKPYLGNKAVQWGQIIVDDLPMMRMSKRDQERYRLNAGDILVCEGGDVGRAAIWNAPISGVFYQKALHRLRPKRGYNSHLLISLLHRYSINGDFSDFVTQTSIAHLSKEKFATVPLPMPSADEQEAIATALKDIDDLIASLDALIAKKRDIKQAAMQQLLTGKTRLAGFEGEWPIRKLGEISELSMGGTPSRKRANYWSGDNVWVSIGDMREKIITSSNEKISDEAASSMNVIPKGTLLMSFKLSLGRLGFAGCDLFTNEAICAFRKLNGCEKFFYHALQRVDFSIYGKQAVKGYTLNKESLASIELAYPPFEEQRAIAAALDDLDEEIEFQEKRRAKVVELRQGMMQQLLTGRIRLI